MTGRYERRAMRNMVASVKRLILASRAAHRRRRVNKLSLEIFACSTSPWIYRLVDAVDSWDVKDLEVVATPNGASRISASGLQIPPWSHQQKAGKSHLRSLKLVNCLPPLLQGFAALTTHSTTSMPVTVYYGVVAAWLQLQVLHLVSRRFENPPIRMVFDAPMSGIRELAIDGSHLLRTVELCSLPKLENLATSHASVQLGSDSAPCLENVKFVFDVVPYEEQSLTVQDHWMLDNIYCVLMRFF